MQAVAITADPALADTLRAGLSQASGQATVARAADQIDKGGDAEIAAIDVGVDIAARVTQCIEHLPDTTRLIVVVSESKPEAMLDAMQSTERVVAALTSSWVTPAQVESIARRAQDGAVFGLEQRLPEGTQVQSVLVGGYRDKLACLDQLEKFAESRKIRGKYRESILQCADEMLMNALYVAPREAASTGRVSATKENIAERARRGVLVRWGVAQRTLFLSVRDTYGSLTREALLRSWRQAIDAGSADAVARGLGLYIMSNGSTSVSFNQIPGLATECVCSFDTTAAKLQIQEFGLFEETDDVRIAEIEAATSDSMMTSELTGVDARFSIPWVLLGLIAVAVIAIVVLALR